MINTAGRRKIWWISGILLITLFFAIWTGFESQFPLFSENRVFVHALGYAITTTLFAWFLWGTYTTLSFDPGTMVLSSFAVKGRYFNNKTIDFDKIDFVQFRSIIYANIKMRGKKERQTESMAYVPDVTVYFPYTFDNFDALLGALKGKNVEIIK